MTLLALARRLAIAGGVGLAAGLVLAVLGVLVSVVEFTSTSRAGQTAPAPYEAIFVLVGAGATVGALSLLACLIALVIGVLRTARRR